MAVETHWVCGRDKGLISLQVYRAKLTRSMGSGQVTVRGHCRGRKGKNEGWEETTSDTDLRSREWELGTR